MPEKAKIARKAGKMGKAEEGKKELNKPRER